MRIYTGTFLIAFSTLALEVTLTRLLSVITWYHLVFFAVSTAMLGMTAGAVTVYLKPELFEPARLSYNLGRACFAYCLVTPVSLLILCSAPLGTAIGVMSFFLFLVDTAACALPFYFSGIAVTAVLTRCNELPIGKRYASDLIGAALGCLLVLAGLEVLDAPSLILLCGAIGLAAAVNFAWNDLPRSRLAAGFVMLALFVTLAFVNSGNPFGIRPLASKGQLEDPRDFFLERWNSFSRIVVYEQQEGPPQYWGPSPKAPRDPILQHEMVIDGNAGTTLRKFSSMEDIEHLKFDVTNIAYYLRPRGGACIIGVGGGRDIQSALLFGHEEVTGIDVNPTFVRLIEEDLRPFAGIADRDEVTLVVDEARSYLSTTNDKYSLIQMSLIDTWAATGAGAFSLSENSLYTREAWQTFLGRLEDDGLFTVSRWYGPLNLGESGRILSLAVSVLLEEGVSDPSRHIAMITMNEMATLILSKRPFPQEEIDLLEELSKELSYNARVLPGKTPRHPILKGIMAARSPEGLRAAIADVPINCEPPTDDNPYFFNMLRLNHLDVALRSDVGVTRGNLRATITLLGLIVALLLLTGATVILPLRLESARRISRSAETFWPGALYFSLIGAGFMLVEIGLIQRLSVYLGHPVYALGILLFTIIASTGVGSYFSDFLRLTRVLWRFLLPVLAALLVLVTQLLLPDLISSTIHLERISKILISIGFLFPLGLLLGTFFPMGMRIVEETQGSSTPWYWALNGILGVFCSALAVFISIYFGISTNFYLSAICYLALLAAIPGMLRRTPEAASG